MRENYHQGKFPALYHATPVFGCIWPRLVFGSWLIREGCIAYLPHIIIQCYHLTRDSLSSAHNRLYAAATVPTLISLLNDAQAQLNYKISDGTVALSMKRPPDSGGRYRDGACDTMCTAVALQ